jgi:hypothetical protein
MGPAAAGGCRVDLPTPPSLKVRAPPHEDAAPAVRGGIELSFPGAPVTGELVAEPGELKLALGQRG